MISMNMKWRMFWLIGMLLLATSITFAQEEDVEGSKDHPLISRYPGLVIKYYDVKEFNEYVLPLGKLEEKKLTKSQRLEGKVTQITYSAPAGRSTLEIYRNYELALKKAGFETLFTVTSKELGEWGWDPFANAFAAATSPRSTEYLGAFLGGEGRYLAAKLTRPEGDIYVALCMAIGWYSNAMVQLDVIELKPMETGLVTVNAEALAQDITRTGHVAIYGIYFDAGKTDVKPESEPTLKEIAKLLQQNLELKLYVVGHTDNIGTLTGNMELSKLRAEAVVKTLISKHGIDSKRLHPVGVGPLAPVISNKTDEGRAKNRRVELVEQ
ncbi:MAG: OmpA family protein [Clostridiales bacterium]|nr:OmpA family protein [Clostridiales bacterium]